MASHDTDIVINIYGESQSVAITNFGRLVWATEDVEAAFTETHRVYSSNNEAQTDADLSAATKLAAAAFFSQDLRPVDFIVASVTYASLDTDLTALLAVFTDWYGVACADRTKATQLLLAAWAAANNRIASSQSLDADILSSTVGNLMETIQDLSNNRCFGSWHDDDAEFVDLNWLATILSADMDSQSSVAHDKELVGVSAPPLTALSTTQAAAVYAQGGNIYLPFKGGPVMRPGVMFGGDWIEDKILEDWLEARLGEAIARLAKTRSNANSKIAYDDFGIADVEGEVRAVIARGETIGHFVADSLVLDVPKLSEISAAVRATKTLTMSGTVQKAGAIKDFNLNIGVVF